MENMWRKHRQKETEWSVQTFRHQTKQNDTYRGSFLFILFFFLLTHMSTAKVSRVFCVPYSLVWRKRIHQFDTDTVAKTKNCNTKACLRTWSGDCTLHLDRDVLKCVFLIKYVDEIRRLKLCFVQNCQQHENLILRERCGETAILTPIEIGARTFAMQHPLLLLLFRQFLSDKSGRRYLKRRKRCKCLRITFSSLLTTNIEPSFNTTRILYLRNPINSATHFGCCSVWFVAYARRWNEMKYNPRFTIYFSLSLALSFLSTQILSTRLCFFFYLAPNAFEFILFVISHPLFVCDFVLLYE